MDNYSDLCVNLCVLCGKKKEIELWNTCCIY